MYPLSNLSLLLSALTASASAISCDCMLPEAPDLATGLRSNDDAGAPFVPDGAVTSVVLDHSVRSGTVSRADVLHEYGHYDRDEPFDLLIYHEEIAKHFQGDDLVGFPSYKQADAGAAFTLIGHLVQEMPGMEYHIVCPAYDAGVDCTFTGHYDASEVADEAENEEGAGVLAPRRELEAADEELACCFSLESTVDVKGKGATPIKDLRLGDMILSDDRGTYTKFYSQGHYHEGAPSEYLRIFTEVAKKPLEASPEHLVFTASHALPVPASAIKVGEVVRTIDGPAKVTAVEKITREGLYSPCTLSGTIVVDGFVASTNIEVPGFEGSRPGWVYLGGRKIVHWHQLSHAAYAPHRLVCGRLAACAEPLDDSGHTPFGRFLLGLAQNATEKQSVLYSFFVLLAVGLAIAPFYAIELLFENAFVVLVGGCVLAGIWRVLADVKVKVKTA